jgi:N,N'-diacetylchitobiose transport system permease protein
MSAVKTDHIAEPSRRRSSIFRLGRGRRATLYPTHLPYLLLVPAIVVLGAVVGYPLVNLVLISFQHYRLRELIQGLPIQWVGLANYAYIFQSTEFWDALKRTLAFVGVNVGLTMVLGLAIALLMKRLGGLMRAVVGTSMVVAWAIPPVAATQLWQWLFDRDFGVVNWLLVSLHFTGFERHSWLSDPVSLLGIATLIVVWGALPFVALTTFAGLTQVPGDLYEAASIDGAGPIKTLRHVVMPLLAPILTILVLLSCIWDFRVFTQVYVLQKSGGISSDTNLLGIWAYHQSFGGSPDYGHGAATSFVGVIILMLLSAFLIRRMLREEREA